MNTVIRPLPFDADALVDLSGALIRSHHENNYIGAVKRLRALQAQLRETAFTTTPGFQLNGLKREELVANNSVVLHELYFDCLGGGGEAMVPAMELALAANFGSVERWREEFVAMGKALGGGSGWVVLTFQPRDGTLLNQWAADHAHSAAGAVPLLALDMYEHAYHIDFGAAAGRYVDAFMENIDWGKVYERYRLAVEQASESLGAEPGAVDGRMLLDVRRAGVYDAADSVIEGGLWRDPKDVDSWAADLPRGTEVVVYCVYGHEVGRATAMRLRAAGVNARFLRGGFDGWKAAGRPLQAKAGLASPS